MKKISLSQHEFETPENGLAIDESLIPHKEDSSETARPLIMKDSSMKKKQMQTMTTMLLIVAVIAGIGTGFGINKLNAQSSFSSDGEITPNELQVGSPTDAIKVGDVYGSPEEANFKDSAEGVVVAGGLDGEGSHQLVRPGGPSQTVYMTSSVVDLSEFEGAKVKVWGETFSAQKAGWLMDIGRVRVIELDAEVPSEE